MRQGGAGRGTGVGLWTEKQTGVAARASVLTAWQVIPLVRSAGIRSGRVGWDLLQGLAVHGWTWKGNSATCQSVWAAYPTRH